MSEELGSGAGSGMRGLKHWLAIAQHRETTSPNPASVGAVVANPKDMLIASGVNIDAPMAPGLSDLTLRQILEHPPAALQQDPATPGELSFTSDDAFAIKPQLALPLANVVVVVNAVALANALANANVVVNANAGANANVTVNTNVTGGPCFVAGTRILTEHGEVPVETLLAGQRVVTLSSNGPTLLPIAWVGERAVNTRFHPQPQNAIPIRIKQNAFEEGVPKRDLLVSPDHAVFLNDVLVPARLLVNGSTVIQDGLRRTVEYFHVELERHAVLVAEGLAAESYLDTGNRGTFINGDEPLVLHPDLAATPDMTRWQTDACAPLAVDPATVEPIWRRIAERAAVIGQPVPVPVTTKDPEIRLLTEAGEVCLPSETNGLTYVFALPQGAATVRLLSRAAPPSDLRPWHDDRRKLGVVVSRLEFTGGDAPATLSAEHPSLKEGWWDVAWVNGAARRWTNGCATIEVPPGSTSMAVHLAGLQSYRCEAPETAAQSAA